MTTLVPVALALAGRYTCITGRDTFLIQLPSAEVSSSGADFEFGIAASPYNGTLCIFGGKLAASGAAACANPLRKAKVNAAWKPLIARYLYLTESRRCGAVGHIV